MPFASDAEMRRVAHHQAAAAREVGADVEAAVYERLMAAGCDERAALRCARDVTRTDDAPPSQHEGGTAATPDVLEVLRVFAAYPCQTPRPNPVCSERPGKTPCGPCSARAMLAKLSAQPPAPSAPAEEPGDE